MSQNGILAEFVSDHESAKLLKMVDLRNRILTDMSHHRPHCFSLLELRSQTKGVLLMAEDAELFDMFFVHIAVCLCHRLQSFLVIHLSFPMFYFTFSCKSILSFCILHFIFSWLMAMITLPMKRHLHFYLSTS